MRARTDNQSTARAGGFTLVEVLVVIVIIAILVSVLLVGVRAAFKTSQRVADQQAARALSMAVQQFKSDNGFLPPLAYDGNPIRTAPPVAVRAGLMNGSYELPTPPGAARAFPVIKVKNSTTRFVAVYNQSADVDFFRGGWDSTGSRRVLDFNFAAVDAGHVSDARYSKFSLPIYLSGVLDKDVDGRTGAGITQPFQDGTFAGVTGEGSPRPVEALVKPTNEIVDLTQTYADNKEASEHTGGASAAAITGRTFGTAFTDRYGRAFRYYRWEPGRNSVDAAAEGGGEGLVAHPADLNIPFVLQDPLKFLEQQSDHEVDATGGDAQVRGAKYAIVAAGPDGFFGTESRALLDVARVATTDEEITRRRADTMKDNVVILEP